MTTMLEQAIIDAEELREAALKSAQQEIVEKYSEEVRSAVQQILEQPEDPMGLDMDMPGEDNEEELADVEMSHMAEDDAMIEIPLDQLIAQAEMETPDADDMVDREDLDVGVPGLEDEEAVSAEPAPANRKDDAEVELNEEELLDTLMDLVKQESVQVDAPDFAMEEIIKDEQETDEEEAEEEMLADNSRDGQEEVKEALAQKDAKIEDLNETINKLKNILAEAKEGLQKLNLSNARLLYTNKVLGDTSLNERQKNKIAEMISESRTVDEAKTVYETLQKTMETGRKAPSSQSLSEAVTRRSSTIISSRREEVSSPKENPALNRWAVLAGLNRDK
tara:strand:+ start:990 stop:1994 length:1005 start_codon:yes stop_codon:yes gene_type:complete